MMQTGAYAIFGGSVNANNAHQDVANGISVSSYLANRR